MAPPTHHQRSGAPVAKPDPRYRAECQTLPPRRLTDPPRHLSRRPNATPFAIDMPDTAVGAAQPAFVPAREFLAVPLRVADHDDARSIAGGGHAMRGVVGTPATVRHRPDGVGRPGTLGRLRVTRSRGQRGPGRGRSRKSPTLSSASRSHSSSCGSRGSPGRPSETGYTPTEGLRWFRLGERRPVRGAWSVTNTRRGRSSRALAPRSYVSGRRLSAFGCCRWGRYGRSVRRRSPRRVGRTAPGKGASAGLKGFSSSAPHSLSHRPHGMRQPIKSRRRDQCFPSQPPLPSEFGGSRA